MNVTPNPYIEQSLTQSNDAIAMNQNNLNSISDYINKQISNFLQLPNGQTIQNVDWSNPRSILSLISSTLIAFTLTVIFLWLIRSIGIYVMAKRKGDKLAFLAFIPYCDLFTMGKIVGKIKILGIEIPKPEYVLPLLILSMYLPYAATISVMLYVYVYSTFLYTIYQEYCPNFAVIFVILSILLPFLIPLFLFFIRNNVHDKKNNEVENNKA